ncbi:hypothetical protein MTO96_049662 [Rhipicephalus appendiculatus]
MPRFRSSGSLKQNAVKYRFKFAEVTREDPLQVIDRLFLKTAFSLGMSAIVQSHECIHAAVKASILLLGFGKGVEDEVYLVDLGLGCRYTQNGKQAIQGMSQEGGIHPLCRAFPPFYHQHLATPVHFHETPTAAKLQGNVDVFFIFKVTVQS